MILNTNGFIKLQEVETNMDNKKIIVCTTDTVPGREIEEYRGMVWASSARSKSIVADFAAVFKSLFGGELRLYQRMGNEARSAVFEELVHHAEKSGADAVVGVKIGSTQLLPSTVEVFAYGTAVTLKKNKVKN